MWSAIIQGDWHLPLAKWRAGFQQADVSQSTNAYHFYSDRIELLVKA
jgi:hypothetical protein